eukprot:TRINITY_DN11590_c2_g3_i1.p1 TRINITY_DN11590_c2_g3~~TRINITY_DN11590_c2_g3_i1.p1  ORF type:complete len:447 (+),score=54.44 TRINITY_DN11590_c2_g3_i1:23-1342(+)
MPRPPSIRASPQNEPQKTTTMEIEISRALMGHSMWPHGEGSGRISAVLFGSWMNLGLIGIPLIIWGQQAGVKEGTLFLFAMMATVPCAERIGYVTEQLCEHTGDAVGGLLNATFGNATELLVSLFALHKRLYRVVQLSLIGSVLSNLLLVLGIASFVGGLRWKVQSFKVISGAVPSTMLLTAAMGFVLPAALKMSGQEDDSGDEINFSRLIAGVFLSMYIGFLTFQLRTHPEEFVVDSPAAHSPLPQTNTVLSKGDAIMWLTVITVAVGYVSDVLVSCLEGFTTQYKVNSVFVSAVLIPVFGNAAEHAAAVMFAYKNRLDLTMGIAVGSSTQIALCLLPFCVLTGWFIDRPLSMFFNGFETAALLMSIVIITLILQSGTSNWLMGLLLMGAYLIVAAGFWVHELEDLTSARGLPEWRRLNNTRIHTPRHPLLPLTPPPL